MCSECGDEEPECQYCGKQCLGTCEDPDSCITCWYDKNADPSVADLGIMDTDLDDCMETECTCECHDELYNEMGHRREAGAWFDDDNDGPPHEREGIFPFLKLPREIRDRIYYFAFNQVGERRLSPYHRGAIHTAFLSTCRLVYTEANEIGHIPMKLNTLQFDGPLSALDFLGFKLMPHQRSMFTKIHIEFHYLTEFRLPPWIPLMRELIKLPIVHLGLTIKGPCSEDNLLGHHCFTARFRVLKYLQSFHASIPFIKSKKEKEIVDCMRERLVGADVGVHHGKLLASKHLRTEDADEGSLVVSKRHKNDKLLTISKVKHQTNTVHKDILAIKCKEEEDQASSNQLYHLERYAKALNKSAAPVEIRLKDARVAVESGDRLEFKKLARGIFSTMEEQFNNIVLARGNLPGQMAQEHDHILIDSPAPRSEVPSDSPI